MSRARQIPLAMLVGIACASTAACSGPGTEPAQAGGAGGTVAAVGAEVERLAVALEGYYRGGEYPTDVAGVLASLDGAGLDPAPMSLRESGEDGGCPTG